MNSSYFSSLGKLFLQILVSRVQEFSLSNIFCLRGYMLPSCFPRYEKVYFKNYAPVDKFLCIFDGPHYEYLDCEIFVNLPKDIYKNITRNLYKKNDISNSTSKTKDERHIFLCIFIFSKNCNFYRK